MNVSVFPRTLQVPRQNRLENITLRGFGGGWNAIETDLQMESTYLVKVRNFRRTPGGTQKIRFGSRWFADIKSAVTGVALDMIYFAGRLVIVTTTGQIATVDGAGSVVAIWNPTIAAALPGAPSGWSTFQDLANFVPFKREMIIHNGRDKPITISDTFAVTYLQDLGTGSNVNVPIGQYGAVVSNYHCIANINPHTASPKPTTIFVSAVGTAGTFPGDPAPNDSIEIDVGAFAPQGAIEIRGIAGFRANLLVFFQDQTVIVKLGTYNAATPPVHTPFFPDTMPTFGLLGHRCVAPVENDLLFAGLGGMASARRNLLSVSGTLESQSLSERIEPPYRKNIGGLTDEQQLKDCWMVYDSLSHDMMLFTPSGQVFVYSFSTKLKYSAWSEYDGLMIKCGCRSFLGRVFYASGTRIYLHGNSVFANEDYFFDRINDHSANWANSTAYAVGDMIFDPTFPSIIGGLSFTCLVAHTSPATGTFADYRAANPGVWSGFGGNPIDFDMELPWLDSKNPMQVKFLRFVGLATKGDAAFTFSAYVDNLYKDVDGAQVFPAAAQMEFVGNEAPVVPGLPRRSDDPRLYKVPMKFKKLKVRVHGPSAGNLEIVNMTFLFNRGKYRR
jgi:hypothetical protein